MTLDSSVTEAILVRPSSNRSRDYRLDPSFRMFAKREICTIQILFCPMQSATRDTSSELIAITDEPRHWSFHLCPLGKFQQLFMPTSDWMSIEAFGFSVHALLWITCCQLITDYRMLRVYERLWRRATEDTYLPISRLSYSHVPKSEFFIFCFAFSAKVFD